MKNSDDSPQGEAARRIFGQFQTALLLYEEISADIGHLRVTKSGEFSLQSARRFAEGLILDQSVSKARDRIKDDPKGAVSFFEIAHEVSDRLKYGEIFFQSESDGVHEPFMLIASAVLNHLDTPSHER